MSILRSLLLAGSQNVWLRERAMRYPFVRRSVSRFMPGERLEDALEASRKLQQSGAPTVLTHLGENIADAAEADAVTSHYLDVLNRVRESRIEAQISVKPTQLGLDLDLEMCFRNLMTLVARAETTGNFVWIDMEGTKYVDLTLDLFRRARSRSARIGVCLQAYLRRSADDLESLLPLAPAIRLVKGAYKEPPTLAYASKRKVDENFYALTLRLLEADAQRAGAFVAIGTHDGTLIERIRASIPHGSDVRYEFEMLFGIQRSLQSRLLADHEPLRVLISYGEFWFPWYMRRLAERPANVLFVAKSIVRG